METTSDALTGLARLRRRIAELERQLGAGPPDPDLRSVLDGMFEGIQVIGFDWRYLYLNETAARHGQRSREELLGRTMIEAYPGIETTEVYGLLQRCMTERSPQQMVNQFIYPDGRTGWFDLRIEPVPLGLLVLSIDVSAQVAAEEELRRRREEEKALTAMLHQAQKMEAIGRLAGGIAHDFNNLLTVIIGYCQVVLEEMPWDDRHRPQLEEVLKAGSRAKSLTRQLLAFSRKQVLQPELLDLNVMVERIEGMLRRLLGEDVDLIARLRAVRGRVMFDPGQIEQILLNLAVNARDAMPRGGKLTIETADVELDEEYARTHRDVQPGPHVMLAVSDTGTGMDAETQARIFEPFFTTKELGRGTGLGLSTVYGIVKQSGGNIWVYSEPGHGTTFKVYLPRAGGEVAAERPTAPEPALPEGRATILLVEDDDGVRGFLRTMLAGAGYTVLDAEDAQRALEASADPEEPIDLLLTDVVLPRMGGRALAERLVSLRPTLKVVYMSGYTDDAIVHHGVLDPGTEFIEKPFTPAALLAKVHAVLAAASA